MDKNFDLSRWMTNLPDSLNDIPITELAIPGSHDALSYSITVDSGISPDADRCIKIAYAFMGPLVRRVMYKWCVTQKSNVMEQLALGIRYFDIRISLKPGDTKNFYVVHGLFGGSVEQPLRSILEFIQQNPGEIVVLDFQHFYSFTPDDHIRLAYLLDNIFGENICPFEEPLNKFTLQLLRAKNYKVIIIYRNRMCGSFWPSDSWPTPWPNTMSTDGLISFLSDGIDSRSPEAGYVSQCVLTPTMFTVLRSPFAGLYIRCGVPASRVTLPWLESLLDTVQLNVAISDFIEDRGAVFPRTVIALNTKLPS